MPVSFRIFPNRGLAFLRFDGHLDLEDMLAMLKAYKRHPDRRPGQKQLIDLGQATGFDRDYAKIFAIRARQIDLFASGTVETLMVHYAPTRIARDISLTVFGPQAPIKGVIPLLQDTEAYALSLLGQPESSFEDLFALADR
ncbi:MAG: hypothetical protein AAGF79_10845 [Pseudomonadota bacterium]